MKNVHYRYGLFLISLFFVERKEVSLVSGVAYQVSCLGASGTD